MNQAAKDALIAAALRGQQQAFDGLGGAGSASACAVVVLARAGIFKWSGSDDNDIDCPMGCNGYRGSEMGMLVHLNDDHKADFLTIANKMPLTEDA